MLLGRSLLALERQVELPLLGRHPVVGIVGRLQDRAEAIVIPLWNRIVLVVVAPRAAHRDAHDRGCDHLNLVSDDVHPLRDEAAFGGVGRVRRGAQKACRGQPVDQFLRHFLIAVVAQFVAGDLLHQKPVIRLVTVERPDHIVAITPRERTRVVVVPETFRIAMPGEVQPVPRPPLAISGRVQQPIDEPLIRVGTQVRQVFLDFLLCRRHPDQIQVRSAHELHALGFS